MKSTRKISMAIMTSISLFSTFVFLFFVFRYGSDLLYGTLIKKASEYYLACLAEASFFGFMFAFLSRE